MKNQDSSALPSHLPSSKFMTYFEIRELVHFGAQSFEGQVVGFERNDARGIKFRDLEFTNYHRACLYLKHVASVELPENYTGLVG